MTVKIITQWAYVTLTIGSESRNDKRQTKEGEKKTKNLAVDRKKRNSLGMDKLV